MVLLKKPIPVTLEVGADKIPGFVMQITPVGIMVELEKIPCKVGAFLMASIQLGDTLINEKVRAIKHYDKFYRSAPKKGMPIENAPSPKKLSELHFVMLTGQSRTAISKFFIKLKTEP